MPLNRLEVMLDIVEEHLQELDFLCEHRASVLFDPDWDLADLRRLELRMESHLDGLVVGQGHSVELALDALAGDAPSLAAAASLALLRIGGEALDSFARMLPELAISALLGVRQASRMESIEPLAPILHGLVADGPTSAQRAVAADILAFHGLRVPELDLIALLRDESPEVRGVAIALSTRLGQPVSREILLGELESEAGEARTLALRAGAESRSAGLLELCRSHPCAEALAFVGVVGTAADVGLLESELDDASRAAAALDALGGLGVPEAVPVLLRALLVAELAIPAAKAFKRVTGLDLEATEESRAQDFDGAQRFWSLNKRRYQEAPRWQMGRRIEPVALAEVFDELSLAIRRDLYLGRRHADAATARLELELPALRQLERGRRSQLR